MKYIIYKITNNINGKIYIGKHKCVVLDDGYMGSGKYLKRAIKKHGIENFTKEILFVYENDDDCSAKEKELVTLDFCKLVDTYNICEGGRGGFSYINSSGLTNKGKDYSKFKRNVTETQRKSASKNLKKAHSEGKIRYDTMLGKKHSDETKNKMSNVAKLRPVEKNPSLGSLWFTNGRNNVKVYPNEEIPEGFYAGRTYPPNLHKVLDLCIECKQRHEDLHWWNLYEKSNMSVSQFCREVYPFIRQNFYGMKKRLGK